MTPSDSNIRSNRSCWGSGGSSSAGDRCESCDLSLISHKTRNKNLHFSTKRKIKSYLQKAHFSCGGRLTRAFAVALRPFLVPYLSSLIVANFGWTYIWNYRPPWRLPFLKFTKKNMGLKNSMIYFKATRNLRPGKSEISLKGSVFIRNQRWTRTIFEILRLPPPRES